MRCASLNFAVDAVLLISPDDRGRKGGGMIRSVWLAGAVVLAVVGVPGLFGSTPNQAVAMDWLTPRLKSQRHDNIRRHQQRLKQQRIKMTAGDHAAGRRRR